MKFLTSDTSLAAGNSPPIAPDFNIFTGAMEVDQEQENVVRMTGSSTERDLHGDTMAISALTDMTKVEPGQVTWLNHNYSLPDSLFGSLLKSPSLTLEGGIADIHIVSDVETSNQASLQTYGYIRKGRRLGCSIGCMVTEFEIDEENDDGEGWWPPIIILHVQVLEYSVVGIPANQRCWVEPATKGLFERMALQGRGDEALKLASAVRGLYPRAYDEFLKKSLDNSSALYRDLERIQTCEAPKKRIEWVPNEKTFVMNQRGAYKALNRNEVTALIATKGRPEQLFAKEFPLSKLLSRETTKGIVPPSSVVQDLLTRGASGKTTWPLASEDKSWDDSTAKKNIKEYAGGDDNIDWGKVHSCCFWFDSEKADTWDGCKLFFVDKEDGEMKAIPHGIYACAESIQGARTPLDIPEEDIPDVKKKIEVYYHKMDKKAPWEEKEDAMKPEKQSGDTAVVPIPGSLEVTTNDGTSVWSYAPTPLDVQLYNALAAKFGQPQIALDASGQVVVPEPAVSSLEIQQAIAKALSFVDIVKEAREFSEENQKALQQLHDDLVSMCMSSFHPCKEMATHPQGGDGDNNEDDKPDGGMEKALTEIASLRADVIGLIDILKNQEHFFDPKAFKDLQGRIDTAEQRLKSVQTQTRAAEENLARLKNTPLGQPTRLNRSTDDGFVRLSAPTMSENERKWSLEEALKATTVVPRTLANNEVLNYRKWPDGVGGTVKDGVRPSLTGAQRQWMHPMEMVAYNDGNEAAVPCYDDPGGAIA